MKPHSHIFNYIGTKQLGTIKLFGYQCECCGYAMALHDKLINDEYYLYDNIPKCNREILEITNNN